MREGIREIDGCQTQEIRFFLDSIAENAKEFARAVRGHWPVENSLHWCLDVCFGDDHGRVRTGNAAGNPAQKNADWGRSYLLSLLKF